MTEKRANCFICGAILTRTKEWSEDYCRKHEGVNYGYNSSSWADWGLVMEHLEKGLIRQGNSRNNSRYYSELLRP